jgi:hypothetical protein
VDGGNNMAIDIPRPRNLMDVFQGINALTKSSLENRKGELENKYYAPNILSEIGQRQATTNKLNTITPLEAQELKIKNAFGPQREQADISNKNAMTNKYNTMTPLEATELAIKNKFGAQREQADIAQKQGQAQYYKSGGAGGSAGGKDIMMLKNQIAAEHPEWNNDISKINEAASAYINGDETLSDGTPLSKPSGIVSSLTDQITKRGNTAAGLNQQRFADTLETTFKMADSNADKAFKFVGAAGKTQKGLDALAGQVGPNDPNYVAYSRFVNEDVPAMVTEIIRTGGANSTNAQKATAFKQAFDDNIVSNPEIAKANYQELKKVYRGIGKTISKGITQTRKSIKNGTFGQEGQVPPPGTIFMIRPDGSQAVVHEENVQEASSPPNNYKLVK